MGTITMPSAKKEDFMFSDALGAWEQIRETLDDAGHIYLFSDFDGTLSPIVEVPGAAVIEPDVKRVLTQLSMEPRLTIAVLSGRCLGDVQARTGLPVIYGGDHGLEMRGPGFEFTAPGAELVRMQLPAVCNAVREAIQRFPGVFLEPKPLTASVHFRQAQPQDVAPLRSAILDCLDPERFEIREGKCVYEVRPLLNWDKGTAVRWLLDRYNADPKHAICIGDDVTDEDMFLSVPEAINVRVLGTNGVDSRAKYWVAQSEVARFLTNLRMAVHEAVAI